MPTPFAGIAEVERRLARLRQGLGKHVEVRADLGALGLGRVCAGAGAAWRPGCGAAKAHLAGGGLLRGGKPSRDGRVASPPRSKSHRGAVKVPQRRHRPRLSPAPIAADLVGRVLPR